MPPRESPLRFEAGSDTSADRTLTIWSRFVRLGRPQAHRPVVATRGESPAVQGEGHRVDRSFVAAEGHQQQRRLDVSQAHFPIVAAGCQSPAILGKCERVYPALVSGQRLRPSVVVGVGYLHFLAPPRQRHAGRRLQRAAVFATESILENTVSMVTGLFGGSPGSTMANTVEADLAALVAQATGPLDFGNSATIAKLIQSVESSTGQNLAANLAAGAASVVAGANQQIESIPKTTGLRYIHEVAQVSIVAQT
jgi:hypothetical protein